MSKISQWFLNLFVKFKNSGKIYKKNFLRNLLRFTRKKSTCNNKEKIMNREERENNLNEF